MEAKDVWATFARGVCMQGLQEVHAQETDACQPAMLCHPAERRGCEGRAGSHRRDECRDELHLSRAPGRGAQRVWGMPGRAEQVREDARLALACVLSACCWCA